MRGNTSLAAMLLAALAASVLFAAPDQPAVEHHTTARHETFRRVPVVAEAIAQRIEKITVLATSYCNRGPTFTGVPAGPGSIAVDPSVVSLGSSIFVPGYGYGVADDTGSLIKGYRIDVWLPTCVESIQWGAQRLTIDVLGTTRVDQHVGG